jgi:hypothetical protein
LTAEGWVGTIRSITLYRLERARQVKEQFEQTGWSLDDLLPATSGPEFERMAADLEARVSEMESWRDRLSSARRISSS